MIDLDLNYEEYDLINKLVNSTTVSADDWTLKNIARKVKDVYDNRRFIKGQSCPYFEMFEVGKDCGELNDCKYCEFIVGEEIYYRSVNNEMRLSLIWKQARNALYDLIDNNLKDAQARLREIMEIAKDHD